MNRKKEKNENDMPRNFNSLLLQLHESRFYVPVLLVSQASTNIRPPTGFCNSYLTFVYVTAVEHHIVHESHTYILI